MSTDPDNPTDIRFGSLSVKRSGMKLLLPVLYTAAGGGLTATGITQLDWLGIQEKDKTIARYEARETTDQEFYRAQIESCTLECRADIEIIRSICRLP